MTTTSGQRFERIDASPASLARAPWPFVERRILRRPSREQLAPTVPAQRPAEPAHGSHQDGDRDPRRLVLARPSWRRWSVVATFAVDALGASLASAATFRRPLAGPGVASGWMLASAVTTVIWLAVLAASGGYANRALGAGPEQSRGVIRAAVVLLAGAAVASYSDHRELAGACLVAWTMCAAVSLFGRTCGRAVLRSARRRGSCQVDLLVVGQERAVFHVVEQVRRERDGGLRLVGACVPGGSSRLLEGREVPVLGDLHDVAAVAKRRAVDAVAVAAGEELHGPALRRLSWELEGTGVELVVAPGLIEVAGPRLHVRQMCGLPLLHLDEPELTGARWLVKGAVDRAVALTALLLLSPLLLGIALAVRATSPGPVLFRQTRIGRRGRPFPMWKFRSMHVDAERHLAELNMLNAHHDGILFKLRVDPRVTQVGRLLRRMSMDELPQLFNVLRGDMSLVGPRPPLPGEVDRYGSDVHRRLLVKPGLTGLWQVSGRSDLPWDESIRLDLRYVENWSLGLDALILWKTLSVVIRGNGAY